MDLKFAILLAASVLAVYWIQERRWQKRLRAQGARQSRYERDTHIMRWRDLFHIYGQDACEWNAGGEALTLLGQAIPYLWDTELHDQHEGIRYGERAKEVAANYGVTLSSDSKQAAMQIIDLSTDILIGRKNKQTAIQGK